MKQIRAKGRNVFKIIFYMYHLYLGRYYIRSRKYHIITITTLSQLSHHHSYHIITIIIYRNCHITYPLISQEEETRALVKSNGGLEPLVALIKASFDEKSEFSKFRSQDSENHGNKELMAAVTGALWKLSMSEENVKCFQVTSPTISPST